MSSFQQNESLWFPSFARDSQQNELPHSWPNRPMHLSPNNCTLPLPPVITLKKGELTWIA